MDSGRSSLTSYGSEESLSADEFDVFSDCYSDYEEAIADEERSYGELVNRVCARLNTNTLHLQKTSNFFHHLQVLNDVVLMHSQTPICDCLVLSIIPFIGFDLRSFDHLWAEWKIPMKDITIHRNQHAADSKTRQLKMR